MNIEPQVEPVPKPASERALLPMPLPAASAATPEAAFAGALASALRNLHIAGGGRARDGDVIALAAERLAMAIQDGRIYLDIDLGINLDIDVDALPIDADALRRSPVVCTPDASGDPAPLVLDGARLYLARYWHYERTLAARLAHFNRPIAGVDAALLQAELARHFDAGSGLQPDWQRIAAATAALRQLCVISGGPGTGKTTTVVRILAILLTLDPNLRIAIAAPTGKAAARVQESMRLQLDALRIPDALKARMPQEPFTIHRLLGYQPGRTTFRHHAGHRLPYDVVVVDEASMLDLALAAKLTGALRDDARLVLLGDKDQLSSVEAGAVYAGISARRAFDPDWARRLAQLSAQSLPELAATAAAPLVNAVVWLEHSYRFDAGGALGQLALAINSGTPERVFALLAVPAADAPAAPGPIRWTPRLPPARVLAEQLLDGFAPYLESVRAGGSPREAFEAFSRFRVLCSTRSGAYGADALGALLTEALRRSLGAPAQYWFAGRPMLVTANDYALQLFNGDVGLVLPDARGAPMVHFESLDGSLRAFACSRLGNVISAMAVTVHRAQGSEFERVAVVIDPVATRGLSRALFYTAVTRARAAVSLYCEAAVLPGAVALAPAAKLGPDPAALP